MAPVTPRRCNGSDTKETARKWQQEQAQNYFSILLTMFFMSKLFMDTELRLLCVPV